LSEPLNRVSTSATVGAIQETVIVLSATPLVDTQNVQQQRTISTAQKFMVRSSRLA
jgi:hypothetical protein